MKITLAKVGDAESNQPEQTSCYDLRAELGGPNEFMTITVAVANDGSDEEACECGIARAKDVARRFADLPPQCFPTLGSGAVLQFADRGLSDAPEAPPDRPRLRDRQGPA
jgi:hypothetical protein